MRRLQLFGNPKVPIWLQGPMDWYESVGVELAVTWGQIPQWVWEVRNMRYVRATTCWLEGTQDDLRDRRRAVLGIARGIISPKDAKELDIDNLYPLIPVETVSPRLANLICVAYKEPPERTFSTDTSINEGFNQLYEEYDINEVMDRAYRAALFTNSVLILWSEEENQFLVLTPEYFRIEENGIWIARRVGIPGTNSYMSPGDIVYDVWNKDTHEVRDAGGRLQVSQCEENPYGMFPGVLLKLTPSNDLYGAGIVEAAEVNAATNLLRLFALRIGLYQGFSVAVGTNIRNESGGTGARNNVRVGPGSMLNLQDPDGMVHPDFKFVSPDGKFEEIERFRRNIISSFERNQDLPAFLIDENAGSPPSGVALQVLERQLNNRRRDHLPALRRTEKTLVEFMTLLARKRGRSTLSADTFEINYADTQEFTDKNEELSYDLELAQNGLINPSQLARKYYGMQGSTTDEEAITLMKQNKAALGFLTPVESQISISD